MESFRLDPAGPLGGILRWLTALARALGLDPAARRVRIRLDRAAAADVRRTLAEWSRGLASLVRAKAARLAARLAARPQVRARRVPDIRPGIRAGGRVGRAMVVVAPARGRPNPPGSSHRAAVGGTRLGRDPAEIIGDAEQETLRRRTRAVLAALLDPAATIRRLAGRLARAGVKLCAKRRFTAPPRRLGAAPSQHVAPPEPPPPRRPALARSTAHTPRGSRGGGVGAGAGWTGIGRSPYSDPGLKCWRWGDQ